MITEKRTRQKKVAYNTSSKSAALALHDESPSAQKNLFKESNSSQKYDSSQKEYETQTASNSDSLSSLWERIDAAKVKIQTLEKQNKKILPTDEEDPNSLERYTNIKYITSTNDSTASLNSMDEKQRQKQNFVTAIEQIRSIDIEKYKNNKQHGYLSPSSFSSPDVQFSSSKKQEKFKPYQYESASAFNQKTKSRKTKTLSNDAKIFNAQETQKLVKNNQKPKNIGDYEVIKSVNIISSNLSPVRAKPVRKIAKISNIGHVHVHKTSSLPIKTTKTNDRVRRSPIKKSHQKVIQKDPEIIPKPAINKLHIPKSNSEEKIHTTEKPKNVDPPPRQELKQKSSTSTENSNQARKTKPRKPIVKRRSVTPPPQPKRSNTYTSEEMKEFMKLQKQRRNNQLKRIESEHLDFQKLKKQRLKELSIKQRELVAKSKKQPKQVSTNSDLYEPTTNDIEEVIQNVGIAAEQAKNVMQQYYGSLDSSFQKEPVLDISKSTEASSQSIKNKTKRLVAIESGAPGPRPGSLNSSFLEELNEPMNVGDTKSSEMLRKDIFQDLSVHELSKQGPSNESKNFLNVDMQQRIQSYVDQLRQKFYKKFTDTQF